MIIVLECPTACQTCDIMFSDDEVVNEVPVIDHLKCTVCLEGYFLTTLGYCQRK